MDIDIDLRPDFNPSDVFDLVYASMNEDGKLRKHPAGVYFQQIPVDPETKLSAIPYKEAEDVGFLKIDLLHLNLLKEFKSKAQMRALLKQEPDWTLLESEKIVSGLFHIGKHFDIVEKVKPRSVQQLSDILALIRPGKIGLLEKYLENPEAIRPELYTKRINSDMRKSHTIPYSLLIVLQLHLIGQQNENTT
jgi:DNA polymerase III alpha subunit